jgi:hypothetical protein
VISILHETKIQTVYMKVQVYSKFRKNKIPKKVKSPNVMRNGRFDTSKCRGKLEKMGVLCTHSPQMPRSTSAFQKKNSKKSKKFKNSAAAVGQAQGRSSTSGHPPATCGSHFILFASPFFLLPPLFFLLLPPLLGTLVNSTSLATAHACPA